MATEAPRMLREDQQRRPVAGRRRLEAVEPRAAARRIEAVEPRASARRLEPRPPESHPPERRTVLITGQPTPARRRRPPAAQGIVARPDRVALWAFLLGLFLVLVAAATANAAPL